MGNKMKGPYKTMCVKGNDDDDGPSNDMRNTYETRPTNKKSAKYIGYCMSENTEYANKSNEDPNSTYDN